MKVLHLCKYDFRTEHGGIESVCKNIYHYFHSEKYKNDTHYFLFFSREKSSVETKEENCIFYNAGLNTQIGSTSVSTDYLRKYFAICNEFDIVHVHVPNPLAFLAIYLKIPKGKVVVHWHSDIVKQKWIYPCFRLIEKKVLRRANTIITTSPNYAKGSKPLALFPNKIHIIPIGIEPLPKTITKASDKNLIVSIGRLVYYKGFDYLIKAAVLLPNDYEIVIVGKGDLKEEYEQLIQSLQLSHKVKLTGTISGEKLDELMNQCKVFCLPSVMRSEAFGVVLLEALSLGKPIVATNIPFTGVNWVNEHDVTGLNVEIKNEKQLAQALIHIMSDDALYTKYSTGAANRFSALFTAEKMNESIYKLYQSLYKE